MSSIAGSLQEFIKKAFIQALQALHDLSCSFVVIDLSLCYSIHRRKCAIFLVWVVVTFSSQKDTVDFK